MSRDETCCQLTEDARWKAYLDGYVLPATNEDENFTVIGFFDEGKYLVFGPYDFGAEANCAKVRLRYSRDDQVRTDWDEFAPANDKAKVLFRLDSPSGPFVGEFSPIIGSWDSYVIGETTISVAGEHTLYVIAHGDYQVANLDWIEITPGTAPASAPTPTIVPTPAATAAPTISNDTVTPTSAPATSSPSIAPTPALATSSPSLTPTPALATPSPSIGPTISPTSAPAEPTLGDEGSTQTGAPSTPEETAGDTLSASAPSSSSPPPVLNNVGHVCVAMFVTFLSLFVS